MAKLCTLVMLLVLRFLFFLFLEANVGSSAVGPNVQAFRLLFICFRMSFKDRWRMALPSHPGDALLVTSPNTRRHTVSR